MAQNIRMELALTPMASPEVEFEIHTLLSLPCVILQMFWTVPLPALTLPSPDTATKPSLPLQGKMFDLLKFQKNALNYFLFPPSTHLLNSGIRLRILSNLTVLFLCSRFLEVYLFTMLWALVSLESVYIVCALISSIFMHEDGSQHWHQLHCGFFAWLHISVPWAWWRPSGEQQTDTCLSAFFVLLQILRRFNRIFSQNAFALVKKIQKWQMKPLAKEQASITVKADLGHWGHRLGRNWHRIRGRNGHQMSLSKPRDWATQPADFFLFMLLR